MSWVRRRGFGVAVNLESNAEVATTTIASNNFNLNSTDLAVLNQMLTATAIAVNNWWGHSSGPGDPAGISETPPCTGNATMDRNLDGFGAAAVGTDFHPALGYTLYCPWLPAPVAITIGGVGGPSAPTNVPAHADVELAGRRVERGGVGLPCRTRRKANAPEGDAPVGEAGG